MTSKAVVEIVRTTETTVDPHLHLLVTTQGELVNHLQPRGHLTTPQLEVNKLAQAKDHSWSAPTVTGLVTQRTSASPRSGPNSPLVSQPHSNLDLSQAMWLMLINISLMNITVPSWHLFLLPLISLM